MTLAERYRRERPMDWAGLAEWANWLFEFDPRSEVKMTDLGAVIVFSDGSKHLMKTP